MMRRIWNQLFKIECSLCILCISFLPIAHGNSENRSIVTISAEITPLRSRTNNLTHLSHKFDYRNVIPKFHRRRPLADKYIFQSQYGDMMNNAYGNHFEGHRHSVTNSNGSQFLSTQKWLSSVFDRKSHFHHLPPSQGFRKHIFHPLKSSRMMARKKIRRARIKRKISITAVNVIVGSAALLPCDLTANQVENSVQLVLWIKEGMHTPLYSYDYRELLNGHPTETKPDSASTLARRTRFEAGKDSPAVLVIENVKPEDTGIYRCRVDFLLTPTRNARINLTVIVPPSRAKVKWKDDISASTSSFPDQGGFVGPCKQAQQPVLICSNDDGFPLPKVLWYEGDALIDDTFISDYNEVINEMQLSPLTRSDFGRRFTCQVSNINISQPATATVSLEMILNIVEMKMELQSPMEADIVSNVRCNVWGSRPAPIIKWWLGPMKLESSQQKTLNNGNQTVSVLQFIPKFEDDGAMLICQAVNLEIVDDIVQDTKLLSVNYKPIVNVRLGRSLNPAKIKEGDDVYFECSVKAKPPVFKVQWKHNNSLLVEGLGVFMSNMSLVVQGVTMANGGNFTCHATNTVGLGISPSLSLDVKYAPVCVTNEKKYHSVAKLENAEILCQVHANPRYVTFRWTFNNTAEAIDVPEGRFVVTGTKSRVNYTPMNELDYGTLLCWANNSIGVQEFPCVFQIVAAGKPDPPHNCKIFDVTISSLQVSCMAGGDGGLTQQFLMQVFKIGSTSPTSEISRPTPSFSVTNLRPATAYKILVASLNDKGASRAVQLKAFTERAPETQEETSAVFLPELTRNIERDANMIPLTIIIGTLITAVILTLTLILLLRTCKRRNSRRNLESNSIIGTTAFKLPISDSTQTVSDKEIELSTAPELTQNIVGTLHASRNPAGFITQTIHHPGDIIHPPSEFYLSNAEAECRQVPSNAMPVAPNSYSNINAIRRCSISLQMQSSTDRRIDEKMEHENPITPPCFYADGHQVTTSFTEERSVVPASSVHFDYPCQSETRNCDNQGFIGLSVSSLSNQGHCDLRTIAQDKIQQRNSESIHSYRSMGRGPA